MPQRNKKEQIVPGWTPNLASLTLAAFVDQLVNPPREKVAELLVALRADMEGSDPGSAEYKASKKALGAKKSTLPLVTPSGVFSRRHRDALICHSGLAVLDYDDLNDPPHVLATLRANPMVVTAFISPLGFGVKAIVELDPIPQDAQQHKVAFRQLKEHFDKLGNLPPVDKSGSDVSRACFVSMDETTTLNEGATPFQWDPNKKPEASTEPPPPPPEESTSEADVVTMLGHINPDSDYETWLTVGMALKSAGHSINLWDQWSQKGPTYDAEAIRYKWEGFETAQPAHGVSMGTITHLAKEGGYKPPRKSARRKKPPPWKSISEDDKPSENKVKPWEFPEGLDITQAVNDFAIAQRFITDLPGHMMMTMDQPPGGEVMRNVYIAQETGLWAIDKYELRRLLGRQVLGWLPWAFLDKVKEMEEEGLRNEAETLWIKMYQKLEKLEKSRYADEALDKIPEVALLWQEQLRYSPNGSTPLKYFSILHPQQLGGDGVVPCSNGIVDLASGKKLTTKEALKRYCTAQINTKYDAKAWRPTNSKAKVWEDHPQTHPILKQLTGHLAPEDAHFLWSYLGRALWNVPYRGAVFLIGQPDSGKTTLLRWITSALHWKGDVLDKDYVQDDSRRASPAKPAPCSLHDASLVYVDEAERVSSSAGEFKELTGGGQREYVCNPKMGKAHSAKQTATVLFAGNSVPTLGAFDPAIQRRMYVVPYPQPEVVDTRVKGLLDEAGEERTKVREAVLAKLLAYAKRYPPSEPLPVSQNVKNATEVAIRAEESELDQFIRTMVDTNNISDEQSEYATEVWASMNGLGLDEFLELGKDDKKALLVDGKGSMSIMKSFTKRLGLPAGTVVRLPAYPNKTSRVWRGKFKIFRDAAGQPTQLIPPSPPTPNPPQATFQSEETPTTVDELY